MQAGILPGMTKSVKNKGRQDNTVGRRIEARLAKLDRSAAEISKITSGSPDLIRNILRKEREGRQHRPRTDTIEALARELQTTVEWLISGTGPEEIDEEPIDGGHIESDAIGGRPQRAATIPVVGYVGAGAEAHFYPPGGDLDRVGAPHGSPADLVAAEIRGDSIGSLFDRWLVFYDDVRPAMTPDLIGKLCVVGLADGRIMVKKIAPGRGKLFNLVSERGPVIENVSIEWAARVKAMAPK
jgi:transcriptional regulator with XRE-family HTH domain